jgi:hypothetical protein
VGGADQDPDLLAEVRLLRAEVDAFTRREQHHQRISREERRKILTEVAAAGEEVNGLRERIEQLHAAAVPRYLWMRVIVRDLETNPLAQYRVNLAVVWFWMIMTVVVTIVFFTAPELWVRISILYVILISHWANIATSYGALSAAIAAISAREAGGHAKTAAEQATQANGAVHGD